MKNINISTKYILIYFANRPMLNVFTNLIPEKGALCDINYIFGDQGIEGKHILQFRRTLLEQDFSCGSFLT